MNSCSLNCKLQTVSSYGWRKMRVPTRLLVCCIESCPRLHTHTLISNMSSSELSKNSIDTSTLSLLGASFGLMLDSR